MPGLELDFAGKYGHDASMSRRSTAILVGKCSIGAKCVFFRLRMIMMIIGFNALIGPLGHCLNSSRPTGSLMFCIDFLLREKCVF